MKEPQCRGWVVFTIGLLLLCWAILMTIAGRESATALGIGAVVFMAVGFYCNIGNDER